MENIRLANGYEVPARGYGVFIRLVRKIVRQVFLQL